MNNTPLRLKIIIEESIECKLDAIYLYFYALKLLPTSP